MAERYIQVGKPSQETLNRLTQAPADITQRNADIYSADGLDVMRGVDYDYDITGQMEDLAFQPDPKRT
jgi:hypothetical protein